VQIVSFGFQSVEFVSRDLREDSGLFAIFIMSFTFLWPNKTLEPTADGVVSSAIAVHAASRRWLSFRR
jgi:hypothetical protein